MSKQCLQLLKITESLCMWLETVQVLVRYYYG